MQATQDALSCDEALTPSPNSPAPLVTVWAWMLAKVENTTSARAPASSWFRLFTPPLYNNAGPQSVLGARGPWGQVSFCFIGIQGAVRQHEREEKRDLTPFCPQSSPRQDDLTL